MDQMMGNLFYRGVQPSEIKAMDYREMKYWNTWHDRIADAEVKASLTARGESGR